MTHKVPREITQNVEKTELPFLLSARYLMLIDLNLCPSKSTIPALKRILLTACELPCKYMVLCLLNLNLMLKIRC